MSKVDKCRIMLDADAFLAQLKARNMTVSEFARAAGICRPTVYDAINHIRPISNLMLCALTTVFSDCNPKDFFYLER